MVGRGDRCTQKTHKNFSITLPSVEALALPVCCPGCVWNASTEQSKPWAHPKGLCGQSLVKRLFTAPANTVYSLSPQFCRSSHCVPTHITHSRRREEKQGKTNEKLWVAALLGAHPHIKPKNCPRRTHAHILHFQLIIAIETLICCCYLHILPHQVGWFCCGVTSATSRGRHPIPYHPASCKPKTVYILLSETIKKRFSIS